MSTYFDEKTVCGREDVVLLESKVPKTRGINCLTLNNVRQYDFPAPLKRPRLGGVTGGASSMRESGLCFTKLSFFVPTLEGALSAGNAESERRSERI